MMAARRIAIGFITLLGFATSAIAQDDAHSVLALNEAGKLEDVKEWAKIKTKLQARNPANVFLVAHGWRTSKDQADETFAYFTRTLRKQQDTDGPIEIIGVRWPSLLGENDTAGDLALQAAAEILAKAIAKSKNLDERKENLKVYLKKPFARVLVTKVLKRPLPDDDEIDMLIDDFKEPERCEHLLTAFTYYQMKKRAGIVGAAGVTTALNELQEALPDTKFHLVGHSFGGKVLLTCLASDARRDKKVDSVTLLQGAVSMYCFASKIEDLKDCPGAYVDVPKRVKGAISVTFTKNDRALAVAYMAASQAAGQIGELPDRKRLLDPTLYHALGGRGIGGVNGLTPIEMGDEKSTYDLRAGFNVFNADKAIAHHGDIRTPAAARLVWSTARFRP